MDTLRADLRHAIRVLRRSPGFTLTTIVTLALAIAANTTTFGFMNALLLQPFKLQDPATLVSLWERHPEQGRPVSEAGNRNRLAVADFLDLRAEAPVFAGLAAYADHYYVVTGNAEPERAMGYRVTPGYFETLGLRPALGRTLLADDGAPEAAAAVVLSHGFWQRRFAGDRAVVGQSLVVDGHRATIVGVLPPGVNFPPGAPDLFAPLSFGESEKAERKKLSVLAVARLREGHSLGSAQASLDALAGRLAQTYPDTNTGRELLLQPLREMRTGMTAPFLLLFELAALFVLLIACANVASLLFGRAASRRRELALRAALGASRGRIVRQLFTEGLVLALLAASGALVLAQVGVDLVRTSAPLDWVRWIPGWTEIRLDARALGFTLAIAVVATLAFALAPALRAARVDLVDPLKAGDRRSSGPPQRRLRGALLVVQVTLALVLLAGAALMTRGFAGLADLYQGFAAERVVTARLDLPERRYPRPQAAQFYGRVLDGLAATPGIEAAGIVSQLPADLGPIPRALFEIEGRPALQLEERPSADLQTVSAGYFGALNVALHRGRGLSDHDGSDSVPVALISESLATRFWPGEDPLGRRIRVAGTTDQPWRTVVGVVSDVRQYWYDRDPRHTLYVPYSQSPRRGVFLLVRSSLDTAATVSAIRARVREADPEQPIDEVRTMKTVVTESASFIRLAAGLMISLGIVALVLAAVGLYGVMADHVAQRTHEIGIRMALGARGTDVLRLVVGEASRLAVLGIVLGLAGAWVLGRVMSSALFGLVRPDVASLAAVTLVFAGVALVAAWVPARRAVRVDPLVTLREE